jgi:hypothetical protein
LSSRRDRGIAAAGRGDRQATGCARCGGDADAGGGNAFRICQQAGAGAGKRPGKGGVGPAGGAAPVLTEPLNLRTSAARFFQAGGRLFGNPINMYKPTTIPRPAL